MKTSFIFAMCCIMASAAIGQIQFEQGYFIDNSGTKVACLIRNADWRNNPEKFRYKLTEEGEVTTASIADVREFGVQDYLKYQRYEVQIDRRSYLANELSQDRNPQLREEQLFLKLLVSGKASLYTYEDGNLKRYFYAPDGEMPKQLIYTKYKSPENKILENFYYKSQLASEVNCASISSNEINETAYTERALIGYFKKYNECSGSEYVAFQDTRESKLFHLNLRPGLGYTSLDVSYYLGNVPQNDFGSQVSWRLGAELEMLLPFNRNKWAITFEPFYRSYKAENDNDTRTEYSSVVTTLGLRHYFFLGNHSKIFINGNFGLDFPISSDFRVATGVTRRDLEVDGNLLDNYWAVGTGYNWNNKFSAELRFMFVQDLLVEYQFWSAEMSGVSLVLGYTIL